MVRKPGQGFELTDEELLATPAKLLTKEQRRRRRVLRKRERGMNARQNSNGRRRNGIKHCQGFKSNGEACGAYAVKGSKHCISHLNDAEKAKLGMKTLQEMGAEARRLDRPSDSKLNAMALGREIMETAQEKVWNRSLAPLGLEFKGLDEEGQPVVIDHGPAGGLCLHGESKDGDIVMTEHPDLAGQHQIAEKLWDRIYGKPRQTQVIEGGNRPLQVQPVRTVERAQQLAELLGRLHALPPGEDVVDIEPTTQEQTGEIVHLRGGNNSVDTVSTPGSKD